MGRPQLRKQPPPILITNSTMLEYMLVRHEDAPIIHRSRGKLRWIVLDEAHTYIGSQAAEVALLLRRVLHAFDVRPEDVRFVATSATIGKPGDVASREQLQEYLASMAGVPLERVQVVEGKRQIPPLPPDLLAQSAPLPELDALSRQEPADIYTALAATKELETIRRELCEGPRRLSSLAEKALGGRSESEIIQTLRILDVARTAKSGDSPLLPLRAHVFHRTQPGLWVCLDRRCSKRQPTLAGDWPYGHIYLERRQQCECGALVFELLLCHRCGAEYLSAEQQSSLEGGDRLIAGPLGAPDSDLMIDDDDERDEEGSGAGDSNLRTPRRIVWSSDSDRTGGDPNDIEVKTGKLVGGDAYRISKRPPTGTTCPRCGEHEFADGEMLRPMRVGAPFFLGVSTPTLLEHVPEDTRSPKALPFGGRRIISFSDSRQGTARFALKSQVDAERNFVRSQLYHLVQSRIPPAIDRAAIAKKLAEYEQSLAAPGIPDVVKDLLRREASDLHEQLSVPLVGVLPWKEAVDALAGSSVLRQSLAPSWQSRGRKFEPNELAELLILREVARRPMRQNSVETLGLVAVRYPALDSLVASGLPKIVAREGLEPGDWHSFLKLLLDLVVRSNTAIKINREQLRWMGMHMTPKFVLGPEADQAVRNARVLWPYVRDRKPRHRFTKLLGYALGLDASHPEGRARINELLLAAWQQLRQARILEPVDDGYQLDLSKAIALSSVSTAWTCPVTRRVLDTTFRGLTPYIPRRANAPIACTRVELPRLRYPFPEHGNADGRPLRVEDVTDWLETDPAVLECRQLGIWTDFSDRLAAFARYYRAEEHSAQQGGGRLKEIEKQFKEGTVNVLSCSTTMEMGVDIGGLSAVAMNNAPPGPSNFLQRAGRAGRRGETAAVSLTMCKAVPHGEAVFRNPLWPFETPIHVPRVSLNSERIVRRHINALAITDFLAGEGSDGMKLRAGWFVEPPSPESEAPADRLERWLRDSAREGNARLCEGIIMLTRGSGLSGQSPRTLLALSADMLRDVIEPWRAEFQRLVDELREAGGPPSERGSGTPAQLAIDRQLRRLRLEYLLGELASRGFLPGYGFPTGIVPFVNTTLEDLRREEERKQQRKVRDDAAEPREDGPDRGRSWPSRGLPTAIREYAPGNDVVIDGSVFRSEGVTLNWQIPPSDRPPPELQSFRFAWRCRDCATSDTGVGRPEACEVCGSRNLRAIQYLQPSGFAVSIICKPHNDLSSNTYVPVKPPWISVGARSWTPLARPELGSMRYNADGLLFHHSAGEHDFGYAVCLVCGRAASETGPSENKPSLPAALDPHYKLRGGKEPNGSSRCPGNDRPHSIKRHQHLGASSRTDVFELQLRDITTGRIVADRTQLSSVAVALRRAAAEALGVEERELGWAVIPSRSTSGEMGCSIALYDTAAGGAGFVGSIPERLPELLAAAKDHLTCPRECDAACHACLLTYDTQHEVRYLDRHEGAKLLTSAFIHALRLPEQYRYFGDRSVSEYQPLAEAIAREVQRQRATELRLMLGGDPTAWDVSAWPLRTEMLGWAASAVSIALYASRAALEALDEANRSALAALVEAAGVRVFAVEKPAEPVELAAELRGSQSVRWAVSMADAKVPGSDWGSGVDVLTVSHRSPEPLPEQPGTLITLEKLRPKPPAGGNFHAVEVQRQLSVHVERFGRGLWSVVFAKVPGLEGRLRTGARVARVEYEDRYLRTPLTIRLLVETIRHLFEEFPTVITGETSVAISTIALDGGSPRGRPTTITHDWVSSSDRNEVVRRSLRVVGVNAAVTELDRHRLAHHRGLILTWENGATWRLRLDEGFGFLTESGRPTRFPFHGDVPMQAKDLVDARFNVDRRTNLPSQLYIEHVE